MRFGRSRLIHEATFDLTPMIDVVLLLIIFFMLTVQFAVNERAPMALPNETGDDAIEVKPAALVVDMGLDGVLSVGGTQTALEDLVFMVKEDSRTAGFELIVRAHRDCPVEHLNRLAEALAGIGVRDWKLATTGDAR